MADSKTRQMQLLDDWRYEHGKPDARYPEPPAVVEKEVTRVIPAPVSNPRKRQEAARTLTDEQWDLVAHPEISHDWRGNPRMRSREHSATAVYDPTVDKYVGVDQLKARKAYFADSLRKDAVAGLFGPGGNARNSSIISMYIPGAGQPDDMGPYNELAQAKREGHRLPRPQTYQMLERGEEAGLFDTPYDGPGTDVGYSSLSRLKNDVDLLKYGLPDGYFGSERHMREEELSQKMGEPLTNEVEIARAIMKKALQAGPTGAYTQRELLYGNKNAEKDSEDTIRFLSELTGAGATSVALLLALAAGGPF